MAQSSNPTSVDLCLSARSVGQIDALETSNASLESPAEIIPPVGQSTPIDKSEASAVSPASSQLSDSTASFFTPIAASGSSKLRKKVGRLSIAESLGRNRSYSDGDIREILKRKREEEHEAFAEESTDLSSAKKINRCLSFGERVDPEDPVLQASSDLNSSEENTIMAAGSESSATDLQSLTALIQSMNAKMDLNQTKLEEKIAKLHQDNVREFHTLREEWKIEVKKTEKQIEDLSSAMNSKYAELKKQVDELPSISNGDILRRLSKLEADAGKSKSSSISTIDSLERRLDFQERTIKKCNIVIKGYTRKSQDLRRDIMDFFAEKFGLHNIVTEVTELSHNPAKPVIVKLHSVDCKKQVLESKNKLVGTSIFIDPDLTKKEQELYRKIRLFAKQKRDNGIQVKIGYSKIFIEGKWVRGDELNQLLKGFTPTRTGNFSSQHRGSRVATPAKK